jgi:hypothetical protein
MKNYVIFLVLMVCVVISAISAGCTGQPTAGSANVAGTSGLQVRIEKNVTVNQAQYKDFNTGRIVVSPPMASFALHIIFTNTGNSPVSLDNYMCTLYTFDPKYNAYQETYSRWGVDPAVRTILEPGSSYQSFNLESYIGATWRGWCSDEERYKFEMKKPGSGTIFSKEFTILPSDCDNLAYYHNGNMDPADYQKYIAGLKNNPANR